MKKLKILHLEDLPSDAELVERVLRKSEIFYEKIVVSSEEQFVQALEQFQPDIILSDHSLPSFNSHEALKIVINKGLAIPFILVTSTVSEEYAVEIMKEGACDYILKDRIQRLPSAVSAAVEKFRLQRLAETERERFQKMQERLITETSVKAQEREREELGRELHDNINQILASTKLYLEAAKGESEIADDLIQKGVDGVMLAIKEIRLLSHRLIAPELSTVSLCQAIEAVVESMNIGNRLHVAVESRQFDETSVSSESKLTMYRIIQEQFNNILKHSQATKAEVKITNCHQHVELTIADNGKGFNTEKVPAGIGLKNMTNRVKAGNGSIKIQSSPGSGCILQATIPVLRS